MRSLPGNPDLSRLFDFACITKTLPRIYYKFMTSLTAGTIIRLMKSS